MTTNVPAAEWPCAEPGCELPRYVLPCGRVRPRCEGHHKASAAAYRAANAEKLKAYRAANAEKVKASAAAYRAANAEKVKASRAETRARYAARTDAECDADYDRLRPDGLKRCRKGGHLAERGAFDRNRTKADGRHDSCREHVGGSWHAAWAPDWLEAGIDPRYCYSCAGLATHGDHLIPQVNPASSDDPSNGLPQCPSCSSSKGHRPLIDWLRSLTVVPYSDGLSSALAARPGELTRDRIRYWLAVTAA